MLTNSSLDLASCPECLLPAEIIDAFERVAASEPGRMMLLLMREGAGGVEEVSAAAGGDADEVLLRRVERGDADGLFRFLLRLAGDRGLAEEILQDTLLAVWRGAAGFAGRSQVRTWLYGIARRQAHNRLRVVRPAESGLAEVAELAEARPGPEELALAGVERDRVLAAVERLSLAHREVVVLMVVAELSHAEIAAVVGVPVGTVKSRLHHARAALVRSLAEVEEPQR